MPVRQRYQVQAVLLVSVTDIDSARPHVALEVETGDVHVIPVSLVKDWATGRVTPPDDVVRAIIGDWLVMLENMK